MFYVFAFSEDISAKILIFSLKKPDRQETILSVFNLFFLSLGEWYKLVKGCVLVTEEPVRKATIYLFQLSCSPIPRPSAANASIWMTSPFVVLMDPPTGMNAMPSASKSI